MSTTEHARRLDHLIEKLEARTYGGHPDGVRQDELSRQAIDAIILLLAEVDRSVALSVSPPLDGLSDEKLGRVEDEAFQLLRRAQQVAESALNKIHEVRTEQFYRSCQKRKRK